MTAQYPEQMRKRLTPPGEVMSAPGDFIIASNLTPPPWRIEITGSDGTMLVVFREENGLLVIEGDESRWDEGAKRFLHGMMQWAGGAGIHWKDEARKAGSAR